MNFGLKPTDYNLIQELAVCPLLQHAATVWIFGSRARGDHKPFSDVDLLFEEKGPLPSGLLFEIKDRLENSNLSVKIDLVERRNLAASYRDQVEREKLPFPGNGF